MPVSHPTLRLREHPRKVGRKSGKGHGRNVRNRGWQGEKLWKF